MNKWTAHSHKGKTRARQAKHIVHNIWQSIYSWNILWMSYLCHPDLASGQSLRHPDHQEGGLCALSRVLNTGSGLLWAVQGSGRNCTFLVSLAYKQLQSSIDLCLRIKVSKVWDTPQGPGCTPKCTKKTRQNMPLPFSFWGKPDAVHSQVPGEAWKHSPSTQWCH